MMKGKNYSILGGYCTFSMCKFETNCGASLGFGIELPYTDDISPYVVADSISYSLCVGNPSKYKEDFANIIDTCWEPNRKNIEILDKNKLKFDAYLYISNFIKLLCWEQESSLFVCSDNTKECGWATFVEHGVSGWYIGKDVTNFNYGTDDGHEIAPIYMHCYPRVCEYQGQASSYYIWIKECLEEIYGGDFKYNYDMFSNASISLNPAKPSGDDVHKVKSRMAGYTPVLGYIKDISAGTVVQDVFKLLGCNIKYTDYLEENEDRW